MKGGPASNGSSANGGGAREPVVWRTSDQRVIYGAKGENTRHIRHGQILERWPILAEPWARRVEDTRLAAVDRTPGAASFGR
jgi:hypothetical protein